MFKRFSTSYMVFLYIMDLVLTGAALYAASVLRFRLPYGDRVPWEMARVPLPVYGLVAVIWMLIFMVLSLYNPNRVFRAIDEFQLVFLGTTLAGLTLAGILYLTFREIPRYLFLYFVLIDLAFLTIYRAVLRAVFRIRRSYRRGMTRVLIIGADSLGLEVAQALEGYRYMGLETVGFLAEDSQTEGTMIEGLPVLGILDQACDVVEDHNIEEVVIALKHHDRNRLANLIAELQKYPVRVKVVPDFFDLAFPHAQVGIFAGIPMIGLREPAIGDFQRFVKRLFDLVATTALLLLLWPLLLVIAVLIKLDSPGPVFYTQKRMGLDAKPFQILKFRAMREGAEENGPGWTTAGDPRRTRLGRRLRRFYLDELPQFINVLLGEMSVVGPRPERPIFVEQFKQMVPRYMERHKEKAGITGWAQVNGLRGDTSIWERTKYDLWYIENWSLWLDFKIMIKTIFQILSGKNAY